jgi:uncharacterized protein YjbI with pentapeptide repeats
MAINSIVQTESITVFGPPDVIEIGLDIGATGERGSYIYSGSVDPNSNPLLFQNNPQKIGDLFLRTSNNTLYQYFSVPGGDQWQVIVNFNPGIEESSELLLEAQIESASAIYYYELAEQAAFSASTNYIPNSSSVQLLSSASATAASYTDSAVANLVGAAPSTLNTLTELASALGNDPNLATTIASVYLTQGSASSTYLTQANASSTYLTQSSASSSYLTQTNATSTYLTQANATSTYLTQANASSTYLTQANASSTYLTQANASTSYSSKKITITEKTEPYTVQLSDQETLIKMNVSYSNTLTVPNNDIVAFSIGTKIDVVQFGTGQTSIAGSAGVNIYATPSANLRAQYSAASLTKVGTNDWLLVGDLGT